MANINDVVNFLVEESIRQDAEGAGVNIILNMSIPGQEGSSVSASAAPSGGSIDPFADVPSGEADLGAAPGGSTGVKTITLNLRRISLLDAIKYITEVAGLKFRLEDNAVIITPAGVVSGHVITRMYPVQPSILDVVIQKGEAKEKTGEFIEMGGSQTTIKRGDVKDFFEKSGVPFPVGTSITYNPTISQLIVANTPENLDTFERILAQLNVIPSQIEIEARFVEVGENDLEELGLQWMLTDNWEIAENTSSGPVGGRERVQINADQDGFTKGLRFFGFDKTTGAIDPASTVTRNVNASPLGGILTAASVLTNPQLKVILQALSQHGNADLLSAPRVTTKNGVNAQIQIVKEIIYPTEFEVTQPTVQSQGDLVTPPTVTPGSFETREVGVILNVTPAVGPDGYTIDLTMVPEVAELVDWIQYGSSITVQGAELRLQYSPAGIQQPQCDDQYRDLGRPDGCYGRTDPRGTGHHQGQNSVPGRHSDPRTPVPQRRAEEQEDESADLRDGAPGGSGRQADSQGGRHGDARRRLSGSGWDGNQVAEPVSEILQSYFSCIARGDRSLVLGLDRRVLRASQDK